MNWVYTNLFFAGLNALAFAASGHPINAWVGFFNLATAGFLYGVQKYTFKTFCLTTTLNCEILVGASQ